MRVVVLGVGDPFTRKYFTSGALLEGPEGYALIDCSDLIHRAIHEGTRRAGWTVESGDIDDVLLTHLHGDHCNGLEAFGFARMIERQRNPLSPRPRLHVSGPDQKRVWERLAPAMDRGIDEDRPARLDDFFELCVLRPEEETRVAGLRVRCRFSGHSVPTLGFLIDDGDDDGDGDGWTLGWSGDTTFDEGHIRWLSQADLVVHETNRGPVHTPVEQLNGLPDELRARMRLIHYPDDFDPRATDIALLREGEVLERPAKPRSQ